MDCDKDFPTHAMNMTGFDGLFDPGMVEEDGPRNGYVCLQEAIWEAPEPIDMKCHARITVPLWNDGKNVYNGKLDLFNML
jgi:hypothetical protein